MGFSDFVVRAWFKRDLSTEDEFLWRFYKLSCIIVIKKFTKEEMRRWKTKRFVRIADIKQRGTQSSVISAEQKW